MDAYTSKQQEYADLNFGELIDRFEVIYVTLLSVYNGWSVWIPEEGMTGKVLAYLTADLGAVLHAMKNLQEKRS